MAGPYGDGLTPQEVRSLYPLLAERAYLFSGGLAPASTRTREAIKKFADEVMNDPGDRYERLDEEYLIIRRLFAQLIGADDDEIVITDCTGAGSNLAVEMLDGSPAANVVLDEGGYPSSVFPWMLPTKKHIELRIVAPRAGVVHIDDLAGAVDDNTIAVSISHVSEMTGFRHDLDALGTLAADHGAALVVDAMQSAGAVQIDVHRSGVHFLACGAMKWLLGSSGVGFLFVDRRYLDRLPPHAGLMGFAHEAGPWAERTLTPKPGADRFRLGAPNLIGLAATTPGLEILLETTMPQVERRVLDLTAYCISELLARGLTLFTPEPEHLRAGIVAIELENANEVSRLMTKRAVDGWSYGNMLRVDPHIFNNQADIDRFLAVIDEAVA